MISKELNHTGAILIDNSAQKQIINVALLVEQIEVANDAMAVQFKFTGNEIDVSA